MAVDEQEIVDLGPWGELRIQQSLEDIMSWQSVYPIRRVVTQKRVWLNGEELSPEDFEGFCEAVQIVADTTEEPSELKA
jgi:hypothetical protein